MPQPKFYLKTEVNKRDNTQHIIMRYYYQRAKRMTFHTGKTIEAKHWSKERHRAKKSYPNAKALNALLDNIAVAAERIVLQAQASGVRLTKEYIVNKLNAHINKTPVTTEQLNLLSFAEQMRDKKRRAAFSNLVNQLQKFRKRRGYSFDFEELDYNFFRAFEQHLIDNEYKDSYIVTILKALKQTVREANRKGITTNNAIVNIKASVTDFRPDFVYLTAEELKQLMRFDAAKELQRTKDIFIAICLTGLAYVDWPQLDLNTAPTLQADNYTFVQITSRAKSGERAFVPLLSATGKVLDQYGDKLPKVSDVVFNRELKELCELAGINEEVTLQESKGGKGYTRRSVKYEEVTSYTGRRTWNSLLRQVAMPDYLIKQLMGHSSGDMTDRYDHRTFKEVAKQITPYLDSLEEQLDTEGPRVWTI